ncbi:MAG TPA: HD domain-containing protein [Polyangiales bacterium]|nr:HD domain-containing protein [Polyangiales bacterium]
MILRDPVHGLVAFEGNAERLIPALLATREVQRLRNVRQLGFTSLAFPGAEHSRFAHCVGAAHVMVRLLARIRAVEHLLPNELRLDAEAEADALAAALLHDLGHGPFSHLFEEVLPDARHHEHWTADILLDPDTDVHCALRGFARGMPERVVSLLRGTHRLGYLSRSVSGMLDVDRCDYLLRDSHMTGVRYGIYDLDWLLRALTFGCVGGSDGRGGRRAEEWVLAIEGRKGLPPIEGFFLARSFMYQQVYHHKATRAAEALIRGIFLRVASLIRAGRVPAETPSAIVAAVSGEPVRLSEYLALDDITLLHAFRVWEHDKDPALADLTRRLQLRQLPKTVPLPPEARDSGVWQRAHELVSEIAVQHGYQPELVVWLDVANEAPYTEPEGESPEGLWVSLRHRPMTRLGRISFMLGELRNKRVERPRLIFPAEIREKVLAAVAGVIDAPASAP